MKAGGERLSDNVIDKDIILIWVGKNKRIIAINTNTDAIYADGFLPILIGSVIRVILSPSKSRTSIITSLAKKIKKLINVKKVGFIRSPIIAPP